jgi:hypothetical protein
MLVHACASQGDCFEESASQQGIGLGAQELSPGRRSYSYSSAPRSEKKSQFATHSCDPKIRSKAMIYKCPGLRTCATGKE